MLKDRNLRNGTLVRLITSFVMAGSLFAISVFLLSVLKLSAFQTGLMLMPMTVGMMLASFIVSKMAVKTGHKYAMGLVMMVAVGLMVPGIIFAFKTQSVRTQDRS